MNSFSEESIRPLEISNRCVQLMKKEIFSFFIDPISKKMKENIADYTNCLACGNTETDYYLDINGFKLERCSQCGFIFVNPRPKESTLINFFKRSESINLYSELVESTKKTRMINIFHPVAESINNLFPQGGELLEVGCGSGLFLESIQKCQKWELTGIEPSLKAVEICRKKGLRVINSVLEDYSITNHYDLVVFWAVLDHFFNPFDIVSKVYTLLKPGGSIFIGNINIYGFDSIILNADNHAFNPPERLNFFGIESMKKMLERAGFKNILTETTGKLDVDIVHNYWKNGGLYNCNDFLEKIIFGSDEQRARFQKYLMENNLSGHMTTTAKK